MTDAPEWLEQAAEWFHGKWHVPVEAYRESMEESLKGKNPVPQWYLMVEQQRIIGGMGVIENDFHNRPDLHPNVCAVYVEPEVRCQGIAGRLEMPWSTWARVSGYGVAGRGYALSLNRPHRIL